jgi:hypothetical protein
MKTVNGNSKKYSKIPRLNGLNMNVKTSHERNTVTNIIDHWGRQAAIHSSRLSKISLTPNPNFRIIFNENMEKTASTIKSLIYP